MSHVKALSGRTRLPAGPGLFEGLGHLLEAFLVWYDRRQERRHVLQLDDRLLRDAGLTYEQARHLGHRPVWRP
jgi:uncharacterized protein YjiS (DUF1127 family)